MFKRMSILLVLMLGLSGILTACGGAAAPAAAPAAGATTMVAFSQLPLYNGATETKNPTFVSALDTILTGMRGETGVKSVDGKAYELSADITWDAVKAFYDGELAKTNWAAGAAAASGGPLMYARGTQGILITYAPGAALTVILTEAK